ncbi:MAG: hypothetical protein EXX96DRAFT_141928 [Benjaminiella poitrasii]|nr:MAG: hypothetical protein EXX96DRAFT_141928 [Benjaminiella poitrasii]
MSLAQGTTLAQFGQGCTPTSSEDNNETTIITSQVSITATATLVYGHCEAGLYCDQAHFCVKQLRHGEVCASDEQCLENLVCYKNTCTMTLDGSDDNNTDNNVTIHIIVSVIGVVLFIAVVIGLYYIYIRRRRNSSKHNCCQNKNRSRLCNKHQHDSNKVNKVLANDHLEEQQLPSNSNISNVLQANYEPHCAPIITIQQHIQRQSMFMHSSHPLPSSSPSQPPPPPPYSLQ